MASLLVFLPKPGGGQRPIALLPCLVRVRGQCRQAQAAQWDRLVDQHCFWGAVGRDCSMAGWTHSMSRAYAAAVGETT
eukprot:12790816-Prorocentrum_lima.AAC.1